MADLKDNESKEEYQRHERELFKNLEGTPQGGPSAADRHLVDPHLPSAQQEQKILDRWEKGLTKSSRSGAFSKPGAGPAIFPNSLKFASDFIDENTPKGWKPSEPMKPLAQQKSPTGHFPKPAAVVDICVSCLKRIDPRAWVLGTTVCLEEDTHKLSAMGMKLGDLVCYGLCVPCDDERKRLAEQAFPLALVRGGELIPDEIRDASLKHGLPVHLHNGTEITVAQMLMQQHAQKLMDNLWDYIKCEHQKPDSPIFRNRGTND